MKSPYARFRTCYSLMIMLVLITSCKDDDKPQVPEIVSINPLSGVPSIIVAISGKYLGPSIDQNKVSFNGVDAVVQNASPGQINVIVPPGATTGPISLIVNGMPATNMPNFTVEHPDAIVNTINPSKGGYNTSIKINGENFYTTASDNLVTINGVPSTVQSSTASELTVLIPRRAGTGDVIVNGVAAVQQFTYVPDIFIVGNEVTATPGVLISKVWKNGIGTPIAAPALTTIVYDIAVDKEDLYAVGTFNGISTVWRNGVPEELTSTFASTTPYFISVVGGDVYCGGPGTDKSGKYYAMYWKNGIADVASPPLPSISTTNFEIHNNEVFMAGVEIKAGILQATYWSGKQTHNLSGITSYMLDIAHDGDDLYCVGWTTSSTGGGATVWKNGVATALLPGTPASSAQFIKIVGDDIYIAGNTLNAGITSVVLWKNGVPTFLSDGTESEIPASLDVIGDDVYILGSEYGATKSVMKYWKNGTPFYVNNGVTAYPLRIIVR
ncbi:MAG: IPT/TIG domain-containing protein [Chryseolinea sp.]